MSTSHKKNSTKSTPPLVYLGLLSCDTEAKIMGRRLAGFLRLVAVTWSRRTDWGGSSVCIVINMLTPPHSGT